LGVASFAPGSPEERTYDFDRRAPRKSSKILTTASQHRFSTSSVRLSDKDVQEAGHHEESFEEFTARYAVPNWRRELLSMFCRAEPKRRNDARQQLSSIANHLVPIYRYEKEFDQVQDVFELQV